MINIRRSKPFKIISVREKSFMELDNELQKIYQMWRDASVLPLNTMEPKPTTVESLPLLPKWDHLTDSISAGTVEMRKVFQEHVIKVENIGGDLKWDNKPDGRPVLNMDSVKTIPRDFLIEIVGIIIQSANADTRPFSPLDISADIVRSRVPRSFVQAVITETVKSDPTKQE